MPDAEDRTPGPSEPSCPPGRWSGLPLRPGTARAVLDRHDGDDEPADDPDELDPAWALARSLSAAFDPLRLVAESPWWRSAPGLGGEALGRLWRHSVAVGLAARRAAREADDPDPGGVGRAGLLHGLGLWAIAASDPERLAHLFTIHDPARRREQVRGWLGVDQGGHGRDLAERLGCDALVVDAAWLHDDRDGSLAGCASDPARLAFIRLGYARAERTPWAMFPAEAGGPGPSPDPRVRLLVAEVQIRCAGHFVAVDASAREEGLANRQARLLLERADLRAELEARDRALAAAGADRSRAAERARLDAAVEMLRVRSEREEPTRRRAKLEALAEFAAGAGHELNNPLAVILGRAQLLMAGAVDPLAVRSLRAIIAQSQRAHRILRDLMYVARPPAFRPRPCRPEEVVRACLRDAGDEAEARGIRLTGEVRDLEATAWADPEPLRLLADAFVRNALEATPPGGSVRVIAGGDIRLLRWTFQDDGKGMTPREQIHLFDPFFCGRSAGRGLGLGLPRAARIVEQAGGELRWHSAPGQGTTFHLTLPLAEPPAAADCNPAA